ncbi:MAG: type II toxin-antitoxin system HicA family toxin [Aggregatilineales bacterium]
MTKLPVVSSKECIKALAKVGFVVSRQKGSHIILYREDPYAKVVVPEHRELAKGTLRRIIRDSDLTVDEFIAILGA